MVWRDSSNTTVGTRLARNRSTSKLKNPPFYVNSPRIGANPENYNLVNSRGSGLKKM